MDYISVRLWTGTAGPEIWNHKLKNFRLYWGCQWECIMKIPKYCIEGKIHRFKSWHKKIFYIYLKRALGLYPENMSKILPGKTLSKLFLKKWENSEFTHKNHFGSFSPLRILLNFPGYVKRISGRASHKLQRNAYNYLSENSDFLY